MPGRNFRTCRPLRMQGRNVSRTQRRSGSVCTMACDPGDCSGSTTAVLIDGPRIAHAVVSRYCLGSAILDSKAEKAAFIRQIFANKCDFNITFGCDVSTCLQSHPAATKSRPNNPSFHLVTFLNHPSSTPLPSIDS